MTDILPPSRLVRFGAFEVDLRTEELWKDGVKLKFSGQPFQVLAILLEHRGEVVSRDELQKHLWPDTFVDTERSLNTAINKIREVLGDSAESPRFVETLPRRGYRFIAPVEGGALSSDPPLDKVPPARATVWGNRQYYRLTLFSAVVFTIGALVLWKTAFQTPRVPRVRRFTQLTNDGQAKAGPLVTDGSRIYFNEVLLDGRRFVTQVSVHGGESVPFAVSLKQPRVLDVSTDGTELLFGDVDDFDVSSFWVQPVAGGSPRRIGTIAAADPEVGAGATFRVDGSGILYANDQDIYSVNRDDSSIRKLLSVEGRASALRFSPDAKVFRFTQVDIKSDSETIFEAKPDGTGLRKLYAGCCGEWTPNARFFLFQNKDGRRNEFWALPEKTGFLQSKQDARPIQLTAGPLDLRYPLPNKDGKEIFAIGTSHRSELLRYDTGIRDFVPYLRGISADSLAFSADGQWVTYTSYPEGALWRSKADGSERLQLTFPPMQVFLPRWSPDGKQIAFNAKIPGETWHIYTVSSEGGTPQRILPGDDTQMDANWSPDGKSLAFSSTGDPSGFIYVVDLQSKRVSSLPGSLGLFSPHWSPDGRYVAAIRAERPWTLNLFDFATQKWAQIFGSGVAYENWSHDGRYLYFQSVPASGDSFRIQRLRVADRRVEEITNLNKIVRLNDSLNTAFWVGIAPDDSPLVFRDTSTQEIYALEMEWQ